MKYARRHVAKRQAELENKMTMAAIKILTPNGTVETLRTSTSFSGARLDSQIRTPMVYPGVRIHDVKKPSLENSLSFVGVDSGKKII